MLLVQSKLDGNAPPCGYFPRKDFTVKEYDVGKYTRYFNQQYQGFRTYLSEKSEKKKDNDDDKKNDDNDDDDDNGDFDELTYEMLFIYIAI